MGSENVYLKKIQGEIDMGRENPVSHEEMEKINTGIESADRFINVLQADISALRNTIEDLLKSNNALCEENKQLLDGRDFLTKALDNAANIEVKMAECLKDQRNRIDALERDNDDMESNEEKHHIEIMELKNELTITRDAYWYLKEKSGQ